MKRVVEPEWLDELPANDPRAIGSRRDLRRINFFMGNVGIIERRLRKSFPNGPPKRIVEIGAGDGTFMLELAKRFSIRWKNIEVLLIDLQDVVSPATKRSFDQLGWRVQVICADVFEWLSYCEPVDGVIANLFLHHFEREKLSLLLHRAAVKTKVFVACEPHRATCGIIGTKFLWAIGCNDVTRHDASASVRAGFRDLEISEIWPRAENWEIDEGRAGLFSHVFATTLRKVAENHRRPGRSRESR